MIGKHPRDMNDNELISAIRASFRLDDEKRVIPAIVLYDYQLDRLLLIQKELFKRGLINKKQFTPSEYNLIPLLEV